MSKKKLLERLECIREEKEEAFNVADTELQEQIGLDIKALTKAIRLISKG